MELSGEMENRTQEIKQESLFFLSVIDLVKEISMELHWRK